MSLDDIELSHEETLEEEDREESIEEEEPLLQNEHKPLLEENKNEVENQKLIALESGQLDSYQSFSKIENDELNASKDSETEDKDEDSEPQLGVMDSLLAFRLLPSVLVAVWVTQFSWWLVVMQISFWWTTWVGVEVYHADPMHEQEEFYRGVTFGIVGSLVHSIVSFFASQGLTYVNNAFGVTRVFHWASILTALSTMALWWFRTAESSMLYMIFTGLLYPVTNTNAFVLIEVRQKSLSVFVVRCCLMWLNADWLFYKIFQFLV